MSIQPESRGLLTSLGVGNFNATMIIPYMMIAPATTDPKSSQVVVLVQHVQRALRELGASDVMITGRLDRPTAVALQRVSGPDWERMSWAANVQAILGAKQAGMWIGRGSEGDASAPPMQGVADSLPAIPGGLITYAVGTAVAVYLLFGRGKRGRRS